MPKTAKSIVKAAAKTSTRMSKKNPLSADLLRRIDAYWRAANYLAAAQIYLHGQSHAAGATAAGCI